MKKILLLIAVNVIAASAFSQFIYKIKADSVLITNDSCNAELNLENSTKNVLGFLYNKGNGRTQFRKGLIKINDSLYIIGADTLNLAAGAGASFWKLNGNGGTNPSTNFIGTTDNQRLVFRTNNTEKATIDANGNVGIGTNAPQQKLDLAGTARIVSASKNTPFLIVDSSNGQRVLEMRAYWEPVESSTSIFIGDSSGALALHGAGYGASINNTALGSRAMVRVTSGGWNTAVGRAAMSSLVSGNFNTSIGEKSMVSFITGDDNTAVGQFALPSLTSGTKNVAVGSNSLEGNTGGSFNTAIGVTAGFLATGSNSTFLGHNAGRSNTGSNNVFLGKDAGNGSGAISDKLYIENSATSTPLIYGDFANDTVRINGKFHANGPVKIDLGSDATGDVFYRNASGQFTRLGIGSSGQVLTVSGGLPAWAAAGGGGSGWALTGNASTNSGTNFLGTTDNISLRIRTNNLQRAVIDSNGKVGINIAAPAFQLDVNGDARVSTLPFLASRDTVLTYDPSSKQIKATLPTVPGTLITVRVFSSGTSYTPTAGTKAILVKLVGGGGGGGGVTGVASNIGAGGGGGGGSSLTKYITGVGAGPFTYAIGAAGTGGVNTGGTGGNGGSTTLTVNAVTYTAPGGSGGVGQTAGTAAAIILGGNGGAISTNGDVNSAGQSGERGFRLSGTVGSSGNGGSSPFGGGGNARNTAGAGNAGTAFGAGGGGALSTAATAQTGGVGTAGVIVIYEYK